MNTKNPQKRSDSTRFFVDPEEFASLISGTSIEETAELAGVSPGTVRRWLAGSSPIPYVVAQLFRLRCRGLSGPDWEGWRFGADGLLYHPFWRRGFTGRELSGMWFEVQQLRTLRAQVRQIEREKERLQEDLERAEDLAGFYRRQVRLEATMGMALVRIAG